MVTAPDSTTHLVTTDDLVPHPLAGLFPAPSEQECKNLKDDIRANGQAVPILLYEGRILDGRSVYAACRALGVPVKYTVFEGNEDEALALLLSRNLMRRHLTTAQRAALAVRLHPFEANLARKRMLAGKADPTQAVGQGRKGEATALAGKRVGVSGESVRQAKRIQAQASDVLDAMLAGKIKNLADAKKLAVLDREDRTAVLAASAGDPDALRDALRIRRHGRSANRATQTASHPPTQRLPVSDRYQVLDGHVLDRLRELADGSVHACVTSPPYYRLRDFGTNPVAWGGDADCSHEWNSDKQCRCGAWWGELGQEPTVDMYVEHLVGVLREIRRVLRPDGSVWLNLADTPSKGSLPLVPDQVALALIDDGWTVRNRITWEKPNPRPSSPRTRIRDTTEVVFVITPKGGGCYYDDWPLMQMSDHGGLCRGTDVWRLSATRGDRGGHAAPFPPELVRRCITAATSAGGCCPACEAPYRRVVHADKPGYVDVGGVKKWKNMQWFTTTGWSPSCSCNAGAPVPCTVLDPFVGSGTTVEVAVGLGRRGVGVELHAEHAAGARTRLAAITPPDELPDLRLSMSADENASDRDAA